MTEYQKTVEIATAQKVTTVPQRILNYAKRVISSLFSGTLTPNA